jgi:hypothetical protein
MKYYIQRGVNEYGPYTLADLQRYVAQGNILMTDLTRSEGMTDWVPVSQVIGNIPVPVPSPVTPVAGGPVYPGTPAAGGAYGAAPAYGTTGQVRMAGPIPPDFHWALVLLIVLFCGIFQLIWILIEASFVRKIRPGNRGTFFIVGGMVVQFLAFVPLFVSAAKAAAENRESFDTGALAAFWLLLLCGFVLDRVGVFQMRAGLLEYYNTVEPINLRLSTVMTFFFAVFYFQYHFTRIATWKKTGYLEPQQ